MGHSRRAAGALAAVLAIVVAPAAARADDRTWYGWQPLITDGSAVLCGAVALGGKSGGTVTGVAALALYALGSPILHAEHGNYGRAGISLGGRLAMPVLGYAIAQGIGGGHGLDAVFRGLIGGLAGAVLAAAIDDAALAWEPGATQASPRRAFLLSYGGQLR